MGIPGFYGHWLARDVREAIFGGIPPFNASLSFDLNGVFHAARGKVFGQDIKDPRILEAIANTPPEQLKLELFNAIATIVLTMIQAVDPQDCVLLMVDGVAPGAKMQQQRGRRERAARERSPNESFDGNAITPGTEFMIDLDNYLVRMIGTYKAHLPVRVVYSSHLIPGEGEHKIMDYYRNGGLADGPAAKAGGAHILYGLDADLIMLSILSGLDNIYLARETTEETVNIDKIKEYIMARGNKERAIDDFVIMMFLIGNDFLPHTASLEEMSESISMLLDIYAQGDYSLSFTDDNGQDQINWDGFKLFIANVAAQENELLATLTTREVKYPSRFLQAATINGQFYPQVFRSTWYQNALGPKGQTDYINVLNQIVSTYTPTEYDQYPERAQIPITTISEVTPQRIEKMAIDYMRTMAWTYLYYSQGTNAVNLDWAYPYYHAPMLSDLSIAMEAVNNTVEITGYQAYEGMIPFTALHQLVAVLPLKSIDLLPIELKPLFSYNSIIRDFFPNNFIIEMDGKNKDHQGVPIVPLIDRRRIIDAVAQITFTPERARLWLPGTVYDETRPEEETERLRRIEFDKQRQANFLAKEAERKERIAKQRGRKQEFQQRPEQYRGIQPRGRGAPRGVARGRGETRPVQNIVPTMTQTAQTSPRRGGRGRGGFQPGQTAPVRGRGGFQPGQTAPGRGRGGFQPTTQTAPRGGRGRGGRDTGPRAPQPTITPQPTIAPQPTITQQQRPMLAPIGTNIPITFPIGRGTTITPTRQVPVTPIVDQPPPLAQITQVKATQPRSPAQWKQLTNLM